MNMEHTQLRVHYLEFEVVNASLTEIITSNVGTYLVIRLVRPHLAVLHSVRPSQKDLRVLLNSHPQFGLQALQVPFQASRHPSALGVHS